VVELDAADLATMGEAIRALGAGLLTGDPQITGALVDFAAVIAAAVYRCYGSSEHPTISSGTVDDPLAKRATTDGRVLGGSEVRLVDEYGDDVPEGAEGEIASRGGELFLGYTDTSLDRESFLPGRWYRTGDIGRLDGDGYLTITDRKKDIIIRGGENISSKEVEDVLTEHPSVLDAAAVGMPDERLGERVCAIVVLGEGAALDVEDVRAHFAAAGLARQKTPERIEIVAELPRTPAGKVQKFVLREQLARGTSA
jgi:acyl-CoA synthetase (AMP-forming)/AMP-acid ligase II